MSGVTAILRLRPVRASDLDAIGALQEVIDPGARRASLRRDAARGLGALRLAATGASCWRMRAHSSSPSGRDRLVGVGGWSPDSLEADLAWLRYLFVHPTAPAGHRAAAGRGGRGGARGHGQAALSRLVEPERDGLLRALGYRRLRQGRWPVTSAIELDYVLLAKDA